MQTLTVAFFYIFISLENTRTLPRFFFFGFRWILVSRLHVLLSPTSLTRNHDAVAPVFYCVRIIFMFIPIVLRCRSMQWVWKYGVLIRSAPAISICWGYEERMETIYFPSRGFSKSSSDSGAGLIRSSYEYDIVGNNLSLSFLFFEA